jgi:hypothetical protein
MAGCGYALGGKVTAQPKGSAMDALAHGGAHMLFGGPKTPFFSAFGSGSNKLQKLVSPEDELNSNTVNYLTKLKKGSNSIDQGVSSLFDNSSWKHDEATDKEKEDIKDYIANNGIGKDIDEQVQQQYKGPQMLAEGGLAQAIKPAKREDPLSSVFPEHNVALNAAKVRVANYLNSQRPSGLEMGLPFDSKRPDKQKEKDYDKLVGLAARPLSVLSHIKQGNITPETVGHFTQMYPDLRDHLTKKMTEEVTKAQLEDRKPPHQIRQGLSLFMGAPMDSSLTPQSIQAAQMVFAQQAAQQQQQPQNQPKKKKNPSALSKMSENYQTGDQAAASRQKQ